MTEAEPFSPIATARRLVRQARTAALATLARRTGHPFGSLVTVATEADGTPIVLLSQLAAHSRNLAEDARASLMIEDRTDADPQTAARVTLVGRIERIVDDATARRRYLTRHPDAALYAGFADFAFHRLVVEDAHLVAGFGRAMRVRAEDLRLSTAAARDLLAGEADLVARLAADPARVAAWATRLGAGEGDWMVVGVDPEGLDLATSGPQNRRFLRLVLPRPATSPESFVLNMNDWEYTSGTQDISQID